VDEAEKFTQDGISWRFSAPAGIVGLWRFNSKNINACDYTSPDLQYAMKNTLWLDIRILLYHFQHLISKTNRNEQAHLPHSFETQASDYNSKEQIFHVATN